MHSNQELELFELLKEKVARQFAANSGILPIEISQWTSEHIRSFQSDLEELLQERISERWIYTHFKSQTINKLPRIDMLNILSKYTGYKSWDDFTATNTPLNKKSKSLPWRPRWTKILAGAGLAGLFLFVFFKLITLNSIYSYHFECVDADLETIIPSSEISVKILEDNQSPRHLESNDSYVYQYQSSSSVIKLIIESPYYINDTIERHLHEAKTEEKLYLRRDDYAILIQKYSQDQSRNTARRRDFLKQILSDRIQVFQITADNLGMEIFTKDEFINRMTLPVNQLRNIEIVSTEYQEGKIIRLRFITKDEPHEKAN